MRSDVAATFLRSVFASSISIYFASMLEYSCSREEENLTIHERPSRRASCASGRYVGAELELKGNENSFFPRHNGGERACHGWWKIAPLSLLIVKSKFELNSKTRVPPPPLFPTTDQQITASSHPPPLKTIISAHHPRKNGKPLALIKS
jgi:hypothetical protein